MRTREEIYDDFNEKWPMHSNNNNLRDRQEFMMEVLLDIRDLLANPPIEITGEPLPE